MRADVQPSPVGVAMEKEVYPSPPEPRPAVEDPFFTKMVQRHARAIFVMFSTFLEAGSSSFVESYTK